MKNSRKTVVALAFVTALTAACGKRHQAARIPTSPPSASSITTIDVKPGYTEAGIASWYGEPYNGRRAANGEIYDMNKLTAAHRTLPFGTRVRVTCIDNQESVDVRITDRGPFVDNRIIDLSLAAAKKIQMVGPGTARVKMVVTAVPSAEDSGEFAVQVAAYRDKDDANRLQKKLERQYDDTYIERFESGDGEFFRVRLGPALTLAKATELSSRLSGQGMKNFVVRVDNC